MSQFDLSQPVNYMNRKMFLDGTVTIQRFDRVHYPRLQKFEDLQRAFIWGPEEVNLSHDRQDMKQASKAQKHVMSANLLRQTVLDSLQGKAPVQVFGPVASVPELEALLNIWSTFETNIHSRSYSHIIRNAFTDPSAIFDKVHEIQEIVNMAAEVGKYYDDLHRANCLVEVSSPDAPSKYEHKKLIWLALHASYALEAIRFMVSFATSLALMEQGIFIGNGKIIELILQDELLHTEWTAWIINRTVKDDPDFQKIQVELSEEVYELYKRVINEEKQWASFLMTEGSMIGLNEKILCSFVDWVATDKLYDIGIKYREESPKSHPIPWFLKHTNLSAQQTALQELESTDYIVGALSNEIDFDELPNL